MADLLARYPEIVALLIVVAAVVVARIAQRLTVLLLGGLNRLLARIGGGDSRLLSPRVEKAAGVVLFWAVLLLGAALALRVLGSGQLSAWLDAALTFVPRLVLAGAIVLLGHVSGLLLRNLLLSAGEPDEVRVLLARLLYAALLVIAVVTALEQLGLGVSFLAQIAVVLLTLFGGGLVLAFALGARQLVANLTARSDFERYALGDRLRVGEHEGVVIEKHRTGLVLSTPEGQVAVPGAHFSRLPVLRLPPSMGGGPDGLEER